MGLVESVYALTNKLPVSEKYALVDQMKRAAISIPSNIAEGQRRASSKEIIQFSSIAFGSLAGLETQLVLMNRIYKIDIENEMNVCQEIGKCYPHSLNHCVNNVFRSVALSIFRSICQASQICSTRHMFTIWRDERLHQQSGVLRAGDTKFIFDGLLDSFY